MISSPRPAATSTVRSGRVTFDSFCFDSRLVRPGQLFLAVKTERADGHDYIADACAGGAAGVLCQHPGTDDVSPPASSCRIPARRSRTGRASSWRNRRWRSSASPAAWAKPRPRRRSPRCSARPDSAVFKNRANYNGLYGLPIALGELRPEQRIAVLEMAADHLGEIGRLARIAPPDIAVVTTVEPAHLEAFGSLEAIAREKGDLVAALRPSGLAVLNADDPRVLAMAGRTSARVVTFGTCDGEFPPTPTPPPFGVLRSYEEGAPNFPTRLVREGQGEVFCPDIYATDILVSAKARASR